MHHDDMSCILYPGMHYDEVSCILQPGMYCDDVVYFGGMYHDMYSVSCHVSQ